MTALHSKSDVTTATETTDRLALHRNTLDEWQLISLEQVRSPFYNGFPSYGKITSWGWIEHFQAIGDGLCGVAATQSGTGAGVGAGAIDATNRIGIAYVDTGTTTTGYAALYTPSQTFAFGGGTHRFRCDTYIPNLSDGTNTYTVRVGFGDSQSGEHTDGIFFRYTHGTNSGKWEAVTRSNSVETATDTGVTVTAGAWDVMEMEVNAAGTSVAFYIDGTLVATNTTNIPTGTSRLLGISFGIIKSAGTTSRTMRTDLMAWYFQPTTAL